MNRRIALCGLVVGIVTLFAAPTLARPNEKAKHETMIGQLINSVRYGQDKSALNYMAGEHASKILLAAAWETGTPAQRTEFTTLFHRIFAGVAFPKMRENFEHLTTITYSAAEAAGESFQVDSVLHIMAGPKEQELKVRYLIAQAADGKPQVVDVTIQGDKSMLTNIRDDQVQPILAEGGWAKLLELMRVRANELPIPADKPLAAKP